MTDITQTITALSTFPDRRNYVSSRAYANDVALWLSENKILSEQLSALIPQLQTFVAELSSAASEIDISVEIVQSAVNYKGDYIPGTYNLNESVDYLGETYLSKINGNTDTPPSANWKLIEVLHISDIGTKVLAPNGDASLLTGLPPSGTKLLFEKSLFGGM